MERLLLLGQDAPLLGKIIQRDLGSASICLSAGSDPDSPSFAYKGHKDFPNEDAALILRDGDRWMLAAADGHMGHYVSHRLLEKLSGISSIPARMGQLSLLLSNEELLEGDERGGSTLLVACLDESTGAVFGLSFGDCCVASLSIQGARIHNTLNQTYLRADGPVPIELGSPFQFTLTSGESLLLYSDGVHECCYRDPYRSVQLSHIEDLYQSSQNNPQQLALALTELALAGVEGHPGGQDNVTVVALARP